METPEPKMTMIYKLPPDVYDEFVARLEDPPEDLEKTIALFQRPSPFTRDCD